LIAKIIALAEQCPLLKYIIVMGPAGERDEHHVAKGSRLIMKTFAEIEELVFVYLKT